MNYYSFDNFIKHIYKPRGWSEPSYMHLYETVMQNPDGVLLEVEGEEYMISHNSQDIVEECSSEMNDFINCFAQGVMV